MIGTYSNLSVVSLDPSYHAKTCNYWYLVRNAVLPHTAFNKREHLMQWLEELGLRLDEDLPAHGTHGWVSAQGTYRRVLDWDQAQFDALPGKRIRTLSNGDYTEGVITVDADGIRTLHVMNPNCPSRKVFDRAESRAMVG